MWAEKLPGNHAADLQQILGFLLNLEASEMIENHLGNVSVSGKSEISLKFYMG